MRHLARDILVGIIGEVFPEWVAQAHCPACTSCRIAVAVNILFIEPIRNRVSIVFGARCSRSASPYAWENTVLPWAVTSTAPANRSSAASRSSVPRSAAVSCPSLRMWKRKAVGPRDRAELHLFDLDRRRRRGIQDHLDELIRQPLLHEGDDVRVRRGVDAPHVESARPASEHQGLIHHADGGWVVLLEKAQVGWAIAAIERVQPCAELPPRGSAHFLRASGGNGQECQEQGDGSVATVHMRSPASKRQTGWRFYTALPPTGPRFFC